MWWQKFQAKSIYPLYCIVLGSKTDNEVALLVQNHLAELDAISGDDCCFIFFRNLKRARNLSPFQYSEHARRVYPLAKFVGIDFSMLPCFLFFEQIDSGKYVHISLAGQSEQEIIVLVRTIFDFIRQRKTVSQLTRLKSFKHSQTLKITRKALVENAIQIGKGTFV